MTFLPLFRTCPPNSSWIVCAQAEPPLQYTVCPLTHCAPSLTKKPTRLASSSALPMRFCGLQLAIVVRMSSLGMFARNMAVEDQCRLSNPFKPSMKMKRP